jgi:cytochrome c oxidase subunit 2
MYKWLMFIMFIGASLLAVGVMTFGPMAPHPAEHAGEEAADPNQLKIVASNFEFDKEEYRVAAGSTLTVSLVNKNGLHGAAVEALGINILADEPQQITFDKPGTYEIKCSILCGVGHAEMVSKLIVE